MLRIVRSFRCDIERAKKPFHKSFDALENIPVIRTLLIVIGLLALAYLKTH